MNGLADIREVGEAVRCLAGNEPFEVAIVLGSGLGTLADQIEPFGFFNYAEFKAFPATQVPGHAGRLVAGLLDGVRIIVFQGRFHLYEGLSARQVSIPVRIAHDLGCRRMLLTNAAGGVNARFHPGDFMLISDHLNFLGDNPLRGESPIPFLDLCALYRQEFFPPLRSFARHNGIRLHRGVLAALPGPSYETPAEIRALRRLGADAVSMSTVPEAIVAHQLGLQVTGLSLISNAAAGLAPSPLSHEEVLDRGRRGAAGLCLLVRRLVTLWKSEWPSSEFHPSLHHS